MRRSEQEITDRAAIDAIIRACQVCRVGLSDEGEPYVVPLCFGYDGESAYFHCATEGRKLEILRRNPRVCLEFDAMLGLVEEPQACRWGIRYQSVIATGHAELIQDRSAKREALAIIMAQYSDREFDFPDAAIDRTCVLRVRLDQVTGKQDG